MVVVVDIAVAAAVIGLVASAVVLSEVPEEDSAAADLVDLAAALSVAVVPVEDGEKYLILKILNLQLSIADSLCF